MLTSLHKESTRQFTDIHFEEQISKSIKAAKSELNEILLSVRDKKAVISYNGQIVTASPTDFPRLLAEWSTSTSVQHAVRNIITSALFSAEEKSSGSAIIAAGMWISDESPTHSLTKRRCTYSEMKDCLEYLGGKGFSTATAQALIDLGSLGCKTEYCETQNSVTKIISHGGIQILGEVEPLFGDRVGRQLDLTNCTVVAVAGSVESLSSLHFLLESSLEKPVIVLAENFLPDVANSLSETWKRNLGKCLPFIVKKWPTEKFLDLEKQGILCVSNERGDTFSALKLEIAGSLNVSTSENACTVSGSKNEVTSKLTVEISQTLGGLTGLVKDRVKMLVGFARQCARGGVVKWEDFSETSQNFSALYSKDLVISSQSVAAGVKASESLKKVLQELGCVILVSQGAK